MRVRFLLILSVGWICVSSAFAAFPVKTVEIKESAWRTQLIYYPDDPKGTEKFPILVISHGNGHNYKYYTYLQKLMASEGFITMSHTNNTGPGIETASTTTLENTDLFLEKLPTLDKGALKGRFDSSRIAWIGHSRGGEGVVRAYDRLIDEKYSTKNYTYKNIKLISSIAPTTFLPAREVDPHEANYHLFVGGADGDVSGRPRRIVMSMPIYERAKGEKQLTYVQGAGHNVFNDKSRDEGVGPSRLKRQTVHEVAKSYYLTLLKIYLKDEVSLKKFFQVHNSVARPKGVPKTVALSNEFKVAEKTKNRLIVDHFQKEPDVTKSSQGHGVFFDVKNITEDKLQDKDGMFLYATTKPDAMNGMTRHIDQKEAPRGVVFDWDGKEFFYTYEFLKEVDLTKYKLLSLRAAQCSNHPLTKKLKADLTFSVAIEDTFGVEAELLIDSYGKVTLPYQRAGGWANEFNTIRMPLEAFKNENRLVQLDKVKKIHFLFGSEFGSEMGRLSLDDIEFLEK